MAKAAPAAAAAPPPKTPKPAEPAAVAADPQEPSDAAPADTPAGESGPLTAVQLRAFVEAATPHERVALLAAALRVAHYEANPRALVWVDFCFGVLTFALEEARLSEPKTLALLRVANEVFGYATSPSFRENGAEAPVFASTEDVYDVFRQLVRAHSAATVMLPPAPPSDSPCDSSSLWDASDVAQIVAFMSSSFFRHLAAYQHVFQRPRESLEREVSLVVESPLPPAPLASATTVVVSPE